MEVGSNRHQENKFVYIVCKTLLQKTQVLVCSKLKFEMHSLRFHIHHCY
jgi:hypothetical protein